MITLLRIRNTSSCQKSSPYKCNFVSVFLQNAMVNVQQYQIVETGGTVAECEANYRRTLADAGVIGAGEASVDSGETHVDEGVITEIRTAVIGGNTHYYVRIEQSPGYLDFSAANMPRAVLLDKGDHIWYTYRLEETEFPENGIVSADSFWFEGEEGLYSEDASGAGG